MYIYLCATEMITENDDVLKVYSEKMLYSDCSCCPHQWIKKGIRMLTLCLYVMY